MLTNKGFDFWSKEYDKSVKISNNDGSYPFVGYNNILNEIYNDILSKSYSNILDLGFGTGTLTSRLYECGYKVYGQDFSEKMLEVSKEKMPHAKLYLGDFSNGLVDPLLEHKYDAIIATYSLHHLTNKKKIKFLKDLQKLLNNKGCIYIGDIIFSSRKEHDKCMIDAKNEWDKDEIYFVVDEFKDYFPKMKFKKISDCLGIITLRKYI